MLQSLSMMPEHPNPNVERIDRITLLIAFFNVLLMLAIGLASFALDKWQAAVPTGLWLGNA